MNDVSIKWIEIASLISKTPYVKIKCPSCDNAFLNIFITPWQGDEPKVDIHLLCEKCNAKNVITKEVSKSNKA
ncbi:hypothetical protein [Phaeodactylibacter luteus]|uniref:Uncharacterized protein n=1 Tax=Phaeodactylibacter luteus TaxID=1564516 RepID=A0A5C6RGA3_9BACT|nr:hypothetical protein [Phaeodactylibacter luteus]TXB58098.1 hypothetical protein FRY97_21655 [Phaeodactylibacter luteus]